MNDRAGQDRRSRPKAGAGGAPALDRRVTIVVAASELFAAKGFAGTGIDEIGARAGVTGPAIYRHFKGKDALLQTIVHETIEAFTLPAATIEAGVVAMAAAAVAAALEDPARLVTYLRERHRLQGEARSELDRAERRLFRPWRDAIRAVNPALGPKEIARRHWAVMTAMSTVAARTVEVPPAACSRLLVSSMVAVLLVPPQRASVRRDERSGWSVEPTRRDLILAAALRLFRERGFHGVSMDDIGEAVGITGPTIYFHYASKAEILADAHERASVRVAVGVQDAVRSATSASDALDRMARTQLGIAADHRDLILVTSRESAPLEDADRERLLRRARDIIDVWVKVLQELRPDLAEPEVRTVVLGVFPLMNQVAYAVPDPDAGAALVRAWALASADA